MASSPLRAWFKKLSRSISKRAKLGFVSESYIKHTIERMLPLTNKEQQPNINQLWLRLRDLEAVQLNVKNMGYALGRALAPSLQKINTQGEPTVHHLVSKPTTQADIESPWFVHWCQELNVAPIYHRKLWEFAFALQALYEAGLLHEGSMGLGFGCGEEPLASYFASKKMRVTVTDLSPEQVAGMGWAETGQHTSAIDQAYYSDLVSREDFESYVKHMFIDMNDVPDLGPIYDFCWSICALEHLGSIDQGLTFIEESMKVLKPGGIAVHTTEFNYRNDGGTIDHWQTVLFQQKHFEKLCEALKKKGHTVLGPVFDVGDQVLDQFVDIPPFGYGMGWLNRELLAKGIDNNPTLKLSIDGFHSTCFGLIVKKGPAC